MGSRTQDLTTRSIVSEPTTLYRMSLFPSLKVQIRNSNIFYEASDPT
jgi:hypothetical protein